MASSSSDKGWIRNQDKATPEFDVGVQAFLKYVEENKLKNLNSNGYVWCPCKYCKNKRMLKFNDVAIDIYKYGFWEDYVVWTKHGESVQQPNIVDDEMMNVLNDVVNAEIHDTDMGEGQVPNENRGCYTKLFEEMEAELYPGFTKMGSLNFIAKLMHIKVKNKWTNSSFTELLELLCSVFPDGHNLPASYQQAIKKLQSLGLGYETIDVCLNDCALYYKETANLEQCPICRESRWDLKKGKKVAHKKLRYFPLAPRLQRLFASKDTAKDMIWHHTGKSRDEDLLRHPVDGECWKEFDTRNPGFARDARNVRLGLATDGFCPFSGQNNPYSMWPVILTTYNLPPWLCMKESTFMLTLLIPGPRSPAKDMDVFLRPLVDELNELWRDGFRTYDAHRAEEFVMKACLLFTTNDYPARSYASGWSGQGFNACPECMVDTPHYSAHKGIVYFDHRRWLPIDHPFRKNHTLYKDRETRPRPIRLSSADIQTQLDGLPYVFPGKHKDFGGKKPKTVVGRVHNWKKKSIFYELPYWSGNLLKHNFDVMHCEKNVCDSLLGTVVCLDGKVNKDNVKARHDLERDGFRKEMWLVRDGSGRVRQPMAKFAMTKETRRQFLSWLKAQKFPDGFASSLRLNVHEDTGKIVGMKSHDCHILMQFLFVASIPKLIADKSVSDAIIGLCNVFRKVCKRNLSKKELEAGKDEVVVLMCKLEMIFPPAFFDIMVHIVMHLYDEALLGGPVQMRWMYPFERYLKKLKEYIRNTARPEGSIAEGYVVEETLTFISRYLTEEKTKFNKPSRYEEILPEPRELSVFKSQGHLKGRRENYTPKHDEMEYIRWYILINCYEIDRFMEAHKNLTRNHPDLKKMSRRKDFRGMLESRHRKDFTKWFWREICRLQTAEDSVVTKEILSLAFGPREFIHIYQSCVINGVKWVSQARCDNRVTQDYGVCSFGGDLTWYGELIHIIRVLYNDDCSVVLFKCKWYKTDKSGLKVENGVTKIKTSSSWWDNEPYILATQAKKVFYVDDLVNGKDWKVVWDINGRNGWNADVWGAESVVSDPIPIVTATTNEVYIPDSHSEFIDVVEPFPVQRSPTVADDVEDILDDTLGDYDDSDVEPIVHLDSDDDISYRAGYDTD